MADGTTRRRRTAAALCAALLSHVLVFVAIERSTLRVRPPPNQRAVELVLYTPQPPLPMPVADEPPPVAAPPPPEPPPPPPRVVDDPPPAPVAPPQAPAPPSQAPAVDVPTAPPTIVESGPGESMVRLPQDRGAVDSVVGGTGPRVLGPSMTSLEGALDFRAAGPLSDGRRAEKNSKRLILDDLAAEDVRSGLTDDYFRVLQDRVETAWRPSVNELNDGGGQVSQVGFLTKAATDPGQYGDQWQAYLDLAKQYSRGERPTLTQERRERLRELMRSRDTALRFNTITEVRVWQGPDGRILTIEVPITSGHPNIDEGIRNALRAAIDAMPDPPPERLHRGRTFKSHWRLRATWTMVPPTAWLSGAAFDITPNGVQVDVPFEIKLKTAVMLQSVDTRSTELPP